MSRNARNLWGLLPLGKPALSGLLALLVGGWLNCEAAETVPQSKVTAQSEAKVVITSNSGAVESYNAKPDIVRQLVKTGIIKITGKADERAAWLSLVSTQDIVGIKVYTNPGRYSGTRPEVVAGVVEGLLAAGIPKANIIIWDRNRVEMQLAGYEDLATRYGVRLEAAFTAGWDPKVFYESSIMGKPIFGDYEFEKKEDGVGRKSFVSSLVSKRLTKIISVAPMLNHNNAGVCGHLYSVAMGSVDNYIRFENDTSRLAVAVPEIYNLTQFADHLVLGITDALICQYQGEQRSLLHYSAVLNELRFSRDPVALDALSVQEIEIQRKRSGVPYKPEKLEIYDNAQLLELGIADLKRVKIERVN